MPLAYLRLALGSLRRAPLRAALTIAAVALASALYLGAAGLHEGYAAALATSVEKMGYHVLVTAKGCPYETATLVLRGGNIPMYVDESLVDLLRADPSWERGTRFLMQGIPNGPQETFTVFLGIDDDFAALKPWMRLQQGTGFSSPEAAEAILGYNVAETLRLKAGDTLDVTRLGRTLAIRGVFDRSGSQDDGMIFLPLAYAQKMFERQGKLTGVGVRLKDPDHLGPFLDRAFEIPSMQAITTTQFRGAILDLLGTARGLMMFGSAVAVLIAALGVFNAVLVIVTERRRELGVYKVLGASPAQVFAAVSTEVALLGLAGGAAGALLAGGLAQIGDGLVARLLPYTPPPAAGTHLVSLTWPQIGVTLVFATLVSILAGAGPALAASLRPAIRSLRGGPV